MFYYSGMCWASFRHPPVFLDFFFFPLCRGDAVECIISCSSSAVWVCHFRTFHQPRIVCLFAWLAFTNRSCALLQSCKAFSLSSLAAVLYNTCFVSSGKAHLSSSCRDHNDWLWSPSLLTWKRKKNDGQCDQPDCRRMLKKYSKIMIFKAFLLYFVLQLHQQYRSWEFAKIGTLAKQMWN